MSRLLLQSVLKQDGDKVSQLLSSSASRRGNAIDIDYKDIDGSSILHHAALLVSVDLHKGGCWGASIQIRVSHKLELLF